MSDIIETDDALTLGSAEDNVYGSPEVVFGRIHDQKFGDPTLEITVYDGTHSAYIQINAEQERALRKFLQAR